MRIWLSVRIEESSVFAFVGLSVLCVLVLLALEHFGVGEKGILALNLAENRIASMRDIRTCRKITH